MTVPQLVEAAKGLDRLETEYENMSGICAVLKGGILRELKAKAGHGNYEKALKEAFPNSARTAQRYARLWDAFTKNDSTVAFETLTRDLTSSVDRLRQFQLDLSHPVVSAVAKWVNGRGAFQLMLDFPGQRGGDTSGSRKKLSPDQEEAAILAAAREDFQTAMMAVDRVFDSGNWRARSVTDRELEMSLDLLREAAKQVSAWLKIPKRERAAKLAEVK